MLAASRRLDTGLPVTPRAQSRTNYSVRHTRHRPASQAAFCRRSHGCAFYKTLLGAYIGALVLEHVNWQLTTHIRSASDHNGAIQPNLNCVDLVYDSLTGVK
jgi:hypothetical protein